jgi:hypothetical protein
MSSPSEEGHASKIDLDTAEMSYINGTELDGSYDSSFGFNMETVQDQKDLIEYIEIYQYHANRWSKVHLVNPRISKFVPNQLSYEDISSPSTMLYTFEYEYALYHNYDSLFSDYESAQEDTPFGEFSNPLEIDHPSYKGDFKVRQRTTEATAEFKPEVGVLPNESLLGNLVTDLSDILVDSPDKIGDAVANAAITGKWESPFDAASIKDSFTTKATNGLKTTSTKGLRSTAVGTSSAFIDVRRK